MAKKEVINETIFHRRRAVRSGLFAGKTLTQGLSLNILTDDELEDIHLGTLEVLEKTGLFVENNEALRVLASPGSDQ